MRLNGIDRSPISQLMRKDKEINALRDEVSTFHLHNQQKMKQIQLMEQEIFKRDKFIVELQNSVRNSVHHDQENDMGYDNQKSRGTAEFNLQVIEELRCENTKLTSQCMKLKSKKSKKKQNDDYKDLLISYNLMLEQNENLKKRLEYGDQKRKEDNDNIPSWSKKSFHTPTLLKAPIQVIPSVTESRPLQSMLPHIMEQSEIVVEVTYTIETSQQLLRESLEREYECQCLLDSVVMKCGQQNRKLMNQNQKLEDTFKVAHDHLQQELLSCYDEMMFYKEKSSVMGELFNHLRKFNEERVIQKHFFTFLKQFQDQFLCLYEDLAGLYRCMTEIERIPIVVNECSTLQQDLIKKIELQQNNFIQIIQFLKVTKPCDHAPLHASLKELLKLSITHEDQNDDLFEGVRRIVQQNNRHDLERKTWDDEKFDLNHQLTNLRNRDEDENRFQKQIQQISEFNTSRKVRGHHQVSPQKPQNQIKDLVYQDTHKMKYAEEDLIMLNHLLVRYKEQIVGLQLEITQHVNQNDRIKRIQEDCELEMERITLHYETKLEGQEQYYLNRFNDMQYSNQRQDQSDIRIRTRSVISCSSEDQQVNQTMDVAQYYRRKSKSIQDRKLKDFESILKYIYEVSKGYDTENRYYLFNKENKDITKIHQNADVLRFIEIKLKVVFKKNPELQLFVRNIQDNIFQSFIDNIQQQNETIITQLNGLAYIQEYIPYEHSHLLKVHPNTQILERIYNILQNQLKRQISKEDKEYLSIHSSHLFDYINKIQEHNLGSLISILKQQQPSCDVNLTPKSPLIRNQKHSLLTVSKQNDEKKLKYAAIDEIQKIVTRYRYLDATKHFTILEQLKKQKDDFGSLMNLYLRGIVEINNFEVLDNFHSQFLLKLSKMLNQSPQKAEESDLAEQIMGLFFKFKKDQLQ